MTHLVPPKTKLQDNLSSGQPLEDSALDHALPPDGHLATHLSAEPLASFLFGPKTSSGILRGKGPQNQDPSTPLPVKPLHSHGDARHVPTGQAGPKDSGPGPPPARRGARPATPPVATTSD